MKFPTYSSEALSSSIQYTDYFRYATLGLALTRIQNEGISGNLAEVGVYKGDMSKYIHQILPERQFYLFDTFEGFPANDLEKDNKDDKRFSDSSIDKVLANIGDSKNIHIKKGYVPETLKGLENERFAFVLLDLDLYNPTIASLDFFYPRLEKGGYLVIHDYNNPESNWACKRAVDEFIADKLEKLVEIADVWGTVIMRKI